MWLRRSGGIGRRAGFKIQCPQGHVGSSPTFGSPLKALRNSLFFRAFCVCLRQCTSDVRRSISLPFFRFAQDSVRIQAQQTGAAPFTSPSHRPGACEGRRDGEANGAHNPSFRGGGQCPSAERRRENAFSNELATMGYTVCSIDLQQFDGRAALRCGTDKNWAVPGKVI